MDSSNSQESNPTSLAFQKTKRLLKRVLSEARDIRLYGERADVLLSRVQGVDFADLDGEDKLRLHRDIAVFDLNLVTTALQLPASIADRVTNAALACLHELVHLWQGIDAKRNVDHLRRAGFENELRHLDLGADHVAAVLLSRFAGDILNLKDIQSRAALAFRVTSEHRPDAARRKRDRFLSLRADICVGRYFHPGQSSEIERRYVYVDLSEENHTLAVYEARGPGKLLRNSNLTPSELRLLCEVFGESGSPDDVIRGVDRLFSEVLVSDRPGGGTGSASSGI